MFVEDEKLKNTIEELRNEMDKLTKMSDMEKHYSIATLLESTLFMYNYIISIIKELDLDVNRLFDLNCGYGYQSSLIRRHNYSYVGIESIPCDFYIKKFDDDMVYVRSKYPNFISEEEYYIDSGVDKFILTNKDLLISIYSLTWGMSFYDRDLLEKQVKQISNDFNHCIVYVNNENRDIFNKYFKNVKEFDGNYIYASNL